MLDVSAQPGLSPLLDEWAVQADIGQAIALLSWDQETYMPPKAAAARAQQLATLTRLLHERRGGAQMKQLLKELQNHRYPEDSIEAAQIRLAQKTFDRATKIPGDFLAEVTKHGSMSQHAWVQAREKNDFASFQPYLETSLDNALRIADYLGYDDHPYNALHDQFEEGSKVAEVKALFAHLRDETVALVQAIQASPRQIDDGLLKRHFPRATQELIARAAAAQIGFDFQAGRLDPTVHPFAMAVAQQDVRITTRYYENFFNAAYFGTLHEAGHGMYEQGLGHPRTPVGATSSLGLHESQSRMWENLVGRSRGYWDYAYPALQEAYPEALGEVSTEDFYRAINRVNPDFIRVEADEVTYNLHIMIRFELELAMLEQQLKVADLPEAWNEKVQDYLGITPPDDAQGCLQDVHWSAGLIGYFPTYTLGNLISVQLFEQAKQDQPAIEADMQQGRFDKLLGWMREHVHQHGSRFTAREILLRSTGRELEVAPYINYLKTKFAALYNIQV